MEITNLANSPEYFEKTIKLIEREFGYEPQNSFKTDFYPLIENSNHEHCYLLIENGAPIGHIGRLKKELELASQSYPLDFFGGIAIAKEYQGRGLFKDFFSKVLDVYKDSALSVLWSDQIELYKKFDFHPCFEQFSYEQKSIEIHDNLEVKEINLSTIQQNYETFKHNEIRVKRNKNDWRSLEKISTANIFGIYKNGKLVNYFIKNKGQDLIDTIHEYGFINEDTLKLLQSFGHVWSASYFESNNPITLFATLSRINNKSLFTQMIQDIFNTDISSLQLSDEDLLQGFFGPGHFAEIKPKKFYFCGLETI